MQRAGIGRRRGRMVAALVDAATVSLMGLPGASGDVTPSEVTVTLAPGQSTVVDKTATVPEIPAKVDVGLLVDMSGSYGDDLASLEEQADDVFDAVSAEADATFGVASFVDFPFNPWGSPPFEDPEGGESFPGDYAYKLHQQLTGDRAAFLAGVDSLEVLGGFDEPESQYEGLFQSVTGAGNDVTPVGPSAGDVAAGGQFTYRADAAKVLVITTDASFHTPGDSECFFPAPPCPFGYPGASRDAVVGALVAAGVRVVALAAPGSGAEMQDLADATGGTVVTTDSASSDIADAIIEGISEVTVDVFPAAVEPCPIDVSFAPEGYSDLEGGSTVEFDETVTVPAGTAPGTYTCTVSFGPAGNQTLTVIVPSPATLNTGRAVTVAGVLPLLGPVGISDTGPVATTGNSLTRKVLLNLPGPLLTVAAADSIVQTREGGSLAASDVAGVVVGIAPIPVIRAWGVSSWSATTCAGSTGVSSIALLQIGTQRINVAVPKNTVINAGLLRVVINEQIPFTTPDGGKGLTVNAIHITGLGINIVIASATSDIHRCTRAIPTDPARAK